MPRFISCFRRYGNPSPEADLAGGADDYLAIESKNNCVWSNDNVNLTLNPGDQISVYSFSLNVPNGGDNIVINNSNKYLKGTLNYLVPKNGLDYLVCTSAGTPVSNDFTIEFPEGYYSPVNICTMFNEQTHSLGQFPPPAQICPNIFCVEVQNDWIAKHDGEPDLTGISKDYRYIGANNATLNWNDDATRFELQWLHILRGDSNFSPIATFVDGAWSTYQSRLSLTFASDTITKNCLKTLGFTTGDSIFMTEDFFDSAIHQRDSGATTPLANNFECVSSVCRAENPPIKALVNTVKILCNSLLDAPNFLNTRTGEWESVIGIQTLYNSLSDQFTSDQSFPPIIAQSQRVISSIDLEVVYIDNTPIVGVQNGSVVIVQVNQKGIDFE